MFTIDTNPEHDRRFDDAAAARLEEWHRLAESGPSLLERAWLRAGFSIDDELDLNGWYNFTVPGRTPAILPARSAGSSAYRAAILARIMRQWEEQGYWLALAPLCNALALVAAEEYGELAA